MTQATNSLRIRFPFSENADVDSALVFTSISAASAHLAVAARMSAPVGGAYNKTDFVLTDGEGSEYKGRIDIQGDVSESTNLAGHVSESCLWVAQNAENLARRGGGSALERTASALHWARCIAAGLERDRATLAASEGADSQADYLDWIGA